MNKNIVNSGIFWVIVIFLITAPLIRIGDNLGLYFDAVFPDYAATQLLDGQEYQEKWFFFWPYLCQAYHGCLTMFVESFAIIITGGTSLLQHRLINAIYILICLLVMDRILASIKLESSTRRMIILIVACTSTVMSFCITQYYIELPGTILMLIALLLMLREEIQNSDRLLLLIFLLIGIAFYSYFNFVFFYPGFLLVELFNKNRARTRTFIISVIGMIPGASIYIYGYMNVYWKQLGLAAAILFGAGTVLVVGVFWNLIKNNKVKICLSIGLILIAILFMIAINLKEGFLNTSRQLNVLGNDATIINRLYLLFQNIKSAFNDASAEVLMLGDRVSSFQNILLLSVISANIFCVILYILRRDNIKRYFKYSFIVVAYLIMCIPLITRMQTQHFVPLFFIWITITSMQLSEIINSSIIIRKEWFDRIFCFVGVVFCCVLLYDRYRVLDKIIETGGNNYYTSQLNKLATDAIDNSKDGKKELYVFNEWGFMSSFNYLTNNNIPFRSEIQIDDLNQIDYITNIQEYNLVFVYWDRCKMKDKYIELIENGLDIIEISNYVDKNNNVVIYKMICK